ncbi:MAG TPA: glutamate--cysteine ligase [Pseudonocardiaceae bacterium]|jgi:gamma-glutamyl:cysteine ligase YbdK (ATP-grasp superfamily)|nr:glutamate--cysteine ligase [Pseudonocardiaceae bacterium]
MDRVGTAQAVSGADRARYRQKVRRCLDALADMLHKGKFFFPQRQMGMEIELNLVDGTLKPAMANTEVLEKIDDPHFTTELGQQNLEINVPPRPLLGDQALQLERDLRGWLELADAKAGDIGIGLVMIGMLPTLTVEHFDAKWLSPGSRYATLNDEIFAARGEDMLVDIEGVAMPGRRPERLKIHTSSIAPESACTSMQLHLQVAPDDFGAYWNAAQALAGVQVALAANSPFLLCRSLWHETRIPLFQQATDTRPEELRNQGVRPRVWFGERWIESIFDLFDENVRYFPGLLTEMDDEDPLDALAEGRAPSLAELRLHNGTVWRWNRPVYDLADGVPHLRLENRVLPAGPTVLDMVANAAFFYGAQRALATQDSPLWTKMSFEAAEQNLHAGARSGMGAQLYWPGIGQITPDELVLRKLLPASHQGLRELGVSTQARERYLGVIEQRCLARQTGSSWQRATVALLEERGADRENALVGMLRRYIELMRSGEPVHQWPIG